MVLPEGFTIPPLPYLVGLTLFTISILVLLLRLHPPVTKSTVLAFSPWMAVGGALHVIYVIDAAPSVLTPLFSTSAVYLTTFVFAGLVWSIVVIIARRREVTPQIPKWISAIGLVFFLGAVIVVLNVGIRYSHVSLVWPLVSIIGSVVLTGGAWVLVSRRVPTITEETGSIGVLVVFAHALDGVTTAVGIDVLGVSERSPLPRLIMDLAGTLPTAELIGIGWLFVLVKVFLAVVLVGLFEEYVRTQPAHGYLVLGGIAAVGLGPGVHNLLLFAVGG